MGETLYEGLKWSESPLRGPASALSGDWTDQPGSAWQEEKRCDDRRKGRKRDLSVYGDIILLLYVPKEVNHSVSPRRVKGGV